MTLWTPKFHDLKPLARRSDPFTMTDLIYEACTPPTEFKLFTIYAGLGKGKSAYAIFVLVETLMNWYKVREREAWDMVKGFICFHPEQFFAKLRQIRDEGLHRVPGLIWDDAGLWLYALDWNDPFVKALGKYMNVARSRLASLILTTPTPQWIIKKLRGFPDAFNVSIIKPTGAPGTQWYREAKGYQEIVLPDMRKSRIYHRFSDFFNCYMPDEFFKWYSPLRDAYEELALALIEKAWDTSRAKSIVPELSDFPNLNLPSLVKPPVVEGADAYKKFEGPACKKKRSVSLTHGEL